ncbi:hypothetical protein MCEGE14_01611 [Burkholderiaceae bacterium]
MRPADNYSLWLAATQASAQAGTTTHVFDVAGITIRARLHHESLVLPFLSAISHLSSSLADAGLDDGYVIDIWDSCHSGVQFPRFHHDIDDVMPRGEVPAYSGDGISFAYFAHARMVQILDQSKKHGIVALVNAQALPAFELACPLRGILSWVLRYNGMAMIHSAALADEDGNAHLIIGNSGAGKSTTAISCLLAGMHYIGDDLCALGQGEDGLIYVHSLYSSGKTYQSEWKFLPQLEKLTLPPGLRIDEFHKEIYFFSHDERLKTQLCRSGKLQTIFVPCKEGSVKATVPTVASLISLTMGSTRELLPDAGFEGLTILGKAFRQAQVVSLPLSHDRQCPVPRALATRQLQQRSG